MTLKIVLIDYGLGNVRSLTNAFGVNGVGLTLTSDMQVIMAADGIILPGVGAFAAGMQKLQDLDLAETIVRFAATGRPILGICLGMQLLFDSSTEFGVFKGLGLIPGTVEKLSEISNEVKRLPHVGWNSLDNKDISQWEGTILEGVKRSTDMYFVHSYCARPKKLSHILSETDYSGVKFCSTVNKGNIYGCQYHPEKSAEAGLRIIKNFIQIIEE